MEYNENNVAKTLFNSDAPYIYDGRGNYVFSARSLAILFNEIVKDNVTTENTKIIEKKVKVSKYKKFVDWGKAAALKKAGWNNKNIAEELGVEEHHVDVYFKANRLGG